MSLTHNEAISEDLVQATLMKGLQSFERFVSTQFPGVLEPMEASRAIERPENAAHLKNWLFRILKNTFLDENVKKRSTKYEISTGDSNDLENTPTSQVEQISFLPASDREATEQELQRFEKEFANLSLDDGWQAKLQDLTSRQRSALFLSAEGYSYKEISIILAVPMGTVMSNLSRALQKLKRPMVGTFGE
jgi:RNA polymerase sigma factor (sigma-70 family)